MRTRRRWGKMDKENIPFGQLVASFEVYNRTVGKSPQTVAWYNSRLALFGRFVGEGCCLGDVTIDRVRQFIVHLQERNTRYPNNHFIVNKEGRLSSAYIQGIVRALRAFATWLHEDGYTETNVLRALKPPRIQQKVVEVLTDDEVKRLVARIDPEHPFGARNFAIIWTLLDCGLRASELCGLKVDDAHLAQGYLKVLGKGNKERLVPIGQSCQEALLRWRDRFRPLFEVADSPFLFLDSNGGPLTVRALEEMVKRAGVRAGVPRVHCHLLRHSFASAYLVKEVGDALRLQQILGHVSLEMVRRYVSLASVQRSLIDRRGSPMDLLAGSRQLSKNARRPQGKKSRRLRLVK